MYPTRAFPLPLSDCHFFARSVRFTWTHSFSLVSSRRPGCYARTPTAPATRSAEFTKCSRRASTESEVGSETSPWSPTLTDVHALRARKRPGHRSDWRILAHPSFRSLVPRSPRLHQQLLAEVVWITCTSTRCMGENGKRIHARDFGMRAMHGFDEARVDRRAPECPWGRARPYC